MDPADVHLKLFLARIAFEAERGVDSLEFFKQYLLESLKDNRELTREEITFFGRTLRCVCDEHCVQLSKLPKDNPQSKECFNLHLRDMFRARVLSEALDVYLRVNELLYQMQQYKLTQKNRVDVLKLTADIASRLTRATRDVPSNTTGLSQWRALWIDQAISSYSAAVIASMELSPSDALRVAVALNFSVFLVEALDMQDIGLFIAKDAFDSCIHLLDQLSEDSYKDTTLVIPLLRDNCTLWSSSVSWKDDTFPPIHLEDKEGWKLIPFQREDDDVYERAKLDYEERTPEKSRQIHYLKEKQYFFEKDFKIHSPTGFFHSLTNNQFWEIRDDKIRPFKVQDIIDMEDVPKDGVPLNTKINLTNVSKICSYDTLSSVGIITAFGSVGSNCIQFMNDSGQLVSTLNLDRPVIHFLFFGGSFWSCGLNQSILTRWELSIANSTFSIIGKEELIGHTAQINELIVSHGKLWSCSKDKTLRTWDSLGNNLELIQIGAECTHFQLFHNFICGVTIKEKFVDVYIPHSNLHFWDSKGNLVSKVDVSVPITSIRFLFGHIWVANSDTFYRLVPTNENTNNLLEKNVPTLNELCLSYITSQAKIKSFDLSQLHLHSHFLDKTYNPKKNSTVISKERGIPIDSEGFTKSFFKNEDEQFLEFFSRYGFVIIRDLIDEKRIDQTIHSIWNKIEKNGRVARKNPLTWNNLDWPGLEGTGGAGFLTCFTDINDQATWDNYQDPNIYSVFSKILKNNNLWVNFSRYGVMRPTRDILCNDASKMNRPEWQTRSDEWLHWDQNPIVDPSFCRVQGILALTDSKNQSGGFHCVPTVEPFELTVKQLQQDHPALIPISKDDKIVSIPFQHSMRSDLQKISVRKGSMIIWDSRLAHGSFPNQSDQFRMVQYISYHAVQTESQRQKRILTFEERTRGKVELTELGELLLGRRAWET